MGVLISCVAVVLRPWTLVSLQCRDGAREVFTDQVDIACFARSALRCFASRVEGELQTTKNHL